MFLKISAAAAALGLLISYLLFTITRVLADTMSYETYDKLRYLFRAIYYLGDFLYFIPMILFFIAFFISQKNDRKVSFSDAPTLYQ